MSESKVVVVVARIGLAGAACNHLSATAGLRHDTNQDDYMGVYL